MTTTNRIESPWLDRQEAADYVGLTVDTLAQMATRGTGPRFAKPSKRIARYRISDLDAWLEATIRTQAEPRTVAKND
jgi:predicted DNA-binding transcriptional regulator AlpA